MLIPPVSIAKWGRTSSIGFNSSDKGSNVTLSTTSTSNDTMVRASSTGWENARCVTSFTSGLWYWEYKMLNTAGSVGIGMMSSGASLTASIGSTANGWGCFWGGTLPIQVTGVTRDYASNLPAASTNDIIGIAYNASSAKAWLHRNGTYFNSGDPGAGTGSVVSAVPSSFFPAGGTFDTGGSLRIITDHASFTYSMPSGFRPYGAASLLVQ